MHVKSEVISIESRRFKYITASALVQFDHEFWCEQYHCVVNMTMYRECETREATRILLPCHPEITNFVSI